MDKQFYPYFDGDAQNKLKAELGQDKLFVFDSNNQVWIATEIKGRYFIDIEVKLPNNILELKRSMEDEIAFSITS